jgi:hypothetical protein
VRPARIQVFDGLRIATEHLDHLQDGLHSSIEDLREAAGLGRIVRGLEVSVDGPAVVVAPGLAFDHARNRVAVDEPQRIDVTFPIGQDAQYLCARYERVENHEVEGKPTLVWDSTRLLLQSTPPAPTDASIPLAKLVRSPDGASFELVSPDAPEPADAPVSTETTSASETTTATETATEAARATSTETSTGSETGTTSTTETTAPAAEAEVTAAAETGTAPVSEPPTPEPSASPVPPVRLRQGVVRLPSAVAQEATMQALVTALRERLVGAPDGDVRVTLGSREVAVDFSPAGITCDTSLTADVRPAAGPGWRCTSTGRGEATLSAGSVLAQYGLSSGFARPLDGTDAVQQRAPELAENRLGSVALAPGAASSGPAGEGWAALEQVTLAVRATPSQSGFGLACELVWSGDVSEARLAALEGEAVGLTWSADVGWKAVGA